MPISHTDPDLWVRRYHPAPDAPTRLLCLPHAGGSASYYFPASRTLSPRIEVLAVQYPGRQDRRTEPAVESIDELADKVVDAVKGWTDRPLAVFGHSMGATLGFEVALRLQDMGATPTCLFASGRRAPSTRRDERVHLQDDDGVIAEIRTLSGTDSRITGDDEVLRMVLPPIRSDYKAIETYTYRPGPRLDCPIQAFVGDSDPKASLAEVRAWKDHTNAQFALHVYPGGHFYLDKHASAVLDKIIATEVPV
jgi:surfactin synthase thioesterase subunit